jgi:hypothetical protein
MKKHAVFALLLVVALAVFAGQVCAKAEAVRSETGKVTAIDPAGKAIVITAGEGKAAMDVGTVIQPDTVLMVKGKKVPLANLQDNVQVGDTVTLKYIKTNDLYAKEIIKK